MAEKKEYEENKDYKEYGSVMAQILSCVRSLRLMEDALTRAASSSNTDEIDRIVREAQPGILTFRGLDRNRIQLEKELGFSGKRLSEIASLLPADETGLKDVLSGLETELLRYKSSREEADRIMKVRLDDVNRVLESQGVLPKDPFHETLA